jgi:dTDP-4-dehydrorhamnose 3,5-epimerase
MIVRPLAIVGAFALEPEPLVDERGTFTRTFCAAAFLRHGLDARVAQTSIAGNPRCGTLRGLHYAAAPSDETKLVRCVRGSLYDVLLDLRRESASFLVAEARELSAQNALALYVPPGVAHGYITLEDETDVLYQMTEEYDAGTARGVRFDDAAFGIEWPREPVVISDRDRNYPSFVV